MKTISLKIDDLIFAETEKIVAIYKKPRNRYINEALVHYNKLQRKKILETQLHKESLLVKDNSMTVLKDFESLDIDD
ncbi:hypothetical protein JXQ31_17085 [candidate division KSB1 bacterium]|nr:hypothetical protein [candidate division KSB1 bacterium]